MVSVEALRRLELIYTARRSRCARNLLDLQQDLSAFVYIGRMFVFVVVFLVSGVIYQTGEAVLLCVLRVMVVVVSLSA